MYTLCATRGINYINYPSKSWVTLLHTVDQVSRIFTEILLLEIEEKYNFFFTKV